MGHLVVNAESSVFSDGLRYRTYYVPIACLERSKVNGLTGWMSEAHSGSHSPMTVRDPDILDPLTFTGMDMLHAHVIEVFEGVEKAVPGFDFGSTIEGFEFSYTPPGGEQS
jgi:hypothetical protein